MNAPDFWNDQKRAQNIIKETNFLKNLIASYETTKSQLENCIETAEELKKSFDEELMMLLEEEYAETMKQFEGFEINVLLSHPYDKNNAILELHPGAGGTESMYNDIRDPVRINIDGHELEITSNVYIKLSTYTLGVTGEYKRILNHPAIWLTLMK